MIWLVNVPHSRELKMVTRFAHKGGSHQNEREWLVSLIYVCCKEVNEICGLIYELGHVV